jgi:hypothetical protein
LVQRVLSIPGSKDWIALEAQGDSQKFLDMGNIFNN